MTGLRHWLHENYPEIYREYERSLIPKNCPRGKESFVCLDCQYAILATTTDEKNRCEIFPNSPLETFIPSPSCKWDKNNPETNKDNRQWWVATIVAKALSGGFTTRTTKDLLISAANVVDYMMAEEGKL